MEIPQTPRTEIPQCKNGDLPRRETSPPATRMKFSLQPTTLMEIPQTPRIEIPQHDNGDLPRSPSAMRIEDPPKPKDRDSPPQKMKTFQGDVPSSHEHEDPPKTHEWKPPEGRSPPGTSVLHLTPHGAGHGGTNLVPPKSQAPNEPPSRFFGQ